MLLYIVRHGEPIYEPDILTALGQAQANALAERFAVHGLDRIYASPLGRAQMTAAPTAKRLSLPIVTLPWTREIWPEMTLQNKDGSRAFVMSLPGTYFRSDENRTLGDAWTAMDCLEGTTIEEAYDWVGRESDAFLASLGYVREGGVYRIERPNDERVAVFCHAGFTLTWLPHLLAIPPHLFWAAFDIGHSGVTLLEFQNTASGYTTPRCCFLSDIGHIYKDGLPYLYNGTLPV